VEYVQSFEASFTTMFAMRSMKECMAILLLSNELYDEWGRDSFDVGVGEDFGWV